jgi:hypothetical protein
MAYKPDWSEAVVLSAPVSIFVTVTLALGTTAPEGSFTVPVICPVSVCAIALTANRNRASSVAKNFEYLLIGSPLVI